MATLSATFAGVPFAEHGSRWDSAWRESRTPWDRGGPSLALHDLLSQRPDLVPQSQHHDHRGLPLRDATGAVEKKKALVPGCGRGHDVLLLSCWGYDVWGLDFSSTAKEQAIKNQKKAEAEGLYKPINGLEKGSVHWVTGDFFSQDWTAGLGATPKFDFIYDYTFLCALPREARPRWSLRMSELLISDGRLVCLEFPTAKPMSEPGPPWGVSPELYEALLSAPGEDIAYHPDGTVDETPSPKPRSDDLHRLSLIKPLRTHADGIGKDGAVLDFISVWSR
ncbi:S-adenosyl-L-methionine-dependent methyltransferase [Dactylonectria macrodidyma]|uniref:S-adenosyl-L-methionine-dependent methyltransferase n=1 Tax=Dactylonectria macrodidyma TaxID=307937 RepID=A0A9P9EY65_9HYPO|nr:S-adenosyl-L-methionine-dependent methyltransferase [Dactylonectria macrodidyma]